MLATGACNNQLTITKQSQNASGALITPTPADANGWTFTNTISSGTIASPVTTAVANGPVNGVAPAAVTVDAGTTPTVSVTETLKTGYTFVSAQCSVGGTNVTTAVTDPLTSPTATFTGAAGQPMACTFTNRQAAGTTTTATVIKNAVGGTTVTGALPLGSSVFDTATVTPTPATNTPTGSVAYTFFTSIGCTTGGTPAGGGALVGGVPPISDPRGPLAAGSYSFRAVFTSGDGNFTGSTSACEPFSVGKGAATTSTQVISNDHRPAPTGSPRRPALRCSTTPPPCSRANRRVHPDRHGHLHLLPQRRSAARRGPWSRPRRGPSSLLGGVPPSSTTGPLPAGSYAFQAVYNGDADYAASTSPCEPFSVGQGAATTSTQVISNATGLRPDGHRDDRQLGVP